MVVVLLTKDSKFQFLSHHLKGLIGDGLTSKDPFSVEVNLDKVYMFAVLAVVGLLSQVKSNARQCLMMDCLLWTRN